MKRKVYKPRQLDGMVALDRACEVKDWRPRLNEVPDEHARLKTKDMVLYKYASPLDKSASLYFKCLCANNKSNVT
jgi:hypothetical protein